MNIITVLIGNIICLKAYLFKLRGKLNNNHTFQLDGFLKIN